MQKLKVPFDTFSSNIDESPLKMEKPQEIVKRLSRLKAEKAYSIYKNHFILSADTVIYVRKKILGKTNSRAIAYDNILKLSGRRHQVFTGTTFINTEGQSYFFLSKTTIKFNLLKKYEIDKYLALNEWQNSAGSYSIQGYAESFASFISGSYSSAIGLPLEKVYKILKKYNLL